MASFEYYKNSNKNYDSNGDIRIPMIDGTLTLEINTTNEVEIEIIYDKYKLWKQLERFGVIKIKVPYTLNKQLYRIYDFEKDMLSYKIKARHIFFDLVDNILLDVRPTNCNTKAALDKILANTGFTGDSDITITNTSYYVNTNSLQAIWGDIDQSILNRWGGEVFQDNFNVIINKRLGDDYGVKIKYGSNLENINLNDNTDGICTRIYPVAYDGVMLPNKYVDSPIINSYPVIKPNFVSMEDLRLKDENTTDTELQSDDYSYFDTAEQLYNAMIERCNALFAGGLDKPTLNGTVDMAILENTIEFDYVKNLVNVGLGDTVTVKYLDIDIDLKIRCTGFKYNLVSSKYNKITLGDLQENYFDNTSNIQSKVDNILNKTNSIFNDDGSIKGDKVAGIIDGTKTQMKVLRNIATDSPVKALLFEDKVKGSASYGAMALGTMGFMIANERTNDDKDWNWKTFGNGSGFVADMITSGKINTNEIDISSVDNTLKLSGNALELFDENGQKTASFQDFGLNIYDCFDAGSFVGGLQSVEDTSNNKLKALQLYVDNMGDKSNNYVALGNRYKTGSSGNDVFKSSLEVHLDHININNTMRFKHQNLDFVDNNYNYVGGIKYFSDDTIGFCTNWNKTMQFCYENNGEWTPTLTINRDGNPRFHLWGNTVINGSFSVTGSKNRIVKTKNYGNVKLNAYETTTPYFGDCGEITLNGNGYCKVYLDSVFKETIESNNKYHVFLTKYGQGDVFISERNEDFFIIKGTPNLTVGYEIKAIQKGYKNIRLEKIELKEQEDL